MARSMEVVAQLRLDAQEYRKGLRNVTSETNAQTAKQNRAFSDLAKSSGQSLSRVGRNLTMKLTLPLAAAGGAAVKMATDFEKSMTSITALVGIASEEVKAMEGQVRSMAVEFGKSGREAADAMFFIQSAGLRGATAMDTLEASLKASAVGLGDTAVIADLATSALNAYKAEGLTAGEATDILAAAVKEGKLQADSLAGAMSRVLPIASGLGVGFEEVGAALASMSRTGTSAEEGATQLRAILGKILKPTEMAKDTLAEYGLTAEHVQSVIREDGLLAGLTLLTDTFGDNQEATARVFEDINALAGVMDMLGGNAADTAAIFASLENASGSVDEAFSSVSQTAAFQFSQSFAQLKDAMLELGQAILPSVVSAMNVVGDVVQKISGWFSGLSDGTKDLIVGMGGVLAITGPLAIGVGALVTAFSALGVAAAPIAITFGAITAAAGFWFANAMESKRRTEELKDELIALDDALVTTLPNFEKLVDETLQLMPDSALDNTRAVFQELNSFAGKGALDAALIESGLGSMFDELNFDAQELESQLRNSNESFALFGQYFDETVPRMENWSTSLSNQTGQVTSHSAEVAKLQEMLEVRLDRALTHSEQKLFDYATANEISTRKVEDLVSELSTLQSTFDSVAKDSEESARTYLTTAENIDKLNVILGGNTREFIESALATAKDDGIKNAYLYTMEQLAGRVDQVRAYTEYGASRMLEYADATAVAAEVANVQANEAKKQAEMLIMAGEAAGYDALMIQNLVRDLGILDQLDPQVAVALGLDVIGGDAILEMIDDLIQLQMGSMSIGELDAGAQFGFGGALGSLMKLRESLADTIAEGTAGGGTAFSTGGGGLQFSGVPEFTGSGGGGGAGSSLTAEADRLASEAERAAEAAQNAVNQFVSGVEGVANKYMSRQWADSLFSGTATEIRDAFRDMWDEFQEIVKESGDTTLEGGALIVAKQFEQLAQLADVRDRLRLQIQAVQALQDDVKGVFDSASRLQYDPEVSLLSQAKRSYTQAQDFVQALRALQGRDVPQAILQDIVSAGIVDGTKMAQEIARMSDSDFGLLKLYTGRASRLGSVASDIAGEMLGLDGMEGGLAGTEDAMRQLTEAIQFDLYDAFDMFLSNFETTTESLLSAPQGLTASGAVAGGVPVVVNVTAPVGSNGADIGQQIVEYLNEYAGTGGRGLNVNIVG